MRVGQIVLRGQILTLGDENIPPIHAPTSGIITKIVKKKFSFFPNRCFSIISIKSDGQDKWIDYSSKRDYKFFSLNEIIQLIYNSGVVGLGGSGFLSSKKIERSIKQVHTLLINAAESEPYITTDDCLMQNFSKEVIQGCKVIAWILKIKNILIAIGDDKDLAYISIKKEIQSLPNFKIRKIKNKYPSGSSKQLIKILFNKEIPLGKHSINLGIIIFNISTVFSIKRSILNREPLIERIITLSDRNLSYQKNILVRIGTPISHILSEFNIKKCDIIMGGPITGFLVDDLNFPILKTTSSILCLKSNLMKNILERPCIRCTACSSACPIRLLPEQLYFYSKSLNHEKSREYHISECIECGICEQVCPSNIPLLTYFKKEKMQLRKIIFQENMSKKSKKLFMLRQHRLYISGLINENIICTNSTVNTTLNNAIVKDEDSNVNILKKSKYIMKKELESAIHRAKLKRNIK
ncbi:MAG: electron transport complex subunit RsxC [Buchnera aphidicola (Schlechtendalia peitan)]